jgi:tetratricopeptide (TPR) repeat protein
MTRQRVVWVVLVLSGLTAFASWQVLRWRESHDWPLIRQRRPEAPPDSVLAVYAYGDSTMEGAPFDGFLGIPQVVEYCLPGDASGRRVAVQNLAAGSMTFLRNPPTVLYEVLGNPDRYRPAAVLLYIGHMELMAARSVTPGLSLARYTLNLVQHFDRTLRTIATRARDAGVPLIVALPVSNLADFPPSGCDDDTRLLPRELDALDSRVAEAESALQAGDPERALELSEGVLARHPGYPFALFEKGRALRALGRHAEANRHFVLANDRDPDSHRAQSPLLDAIRRACGEGLATCVDASPDMAARYGALDDRSFADGHHPNAVGYAFLGQAFAVALARVLGLPAPRLFDPEHLPPELDVSRRLFDGRLSTATWFAQHAVMTRSVRRAWMADRAVAILDGLESIAVSEQDRKKLAARRILPAVLRGEKPAARRWLEEARIAPVPEDTERFLEMLSVYFRNSPELGFDL